MRPTIFLAAVVVAVAACTESPTQIANPELSLSASEASHGQVVGSASGSGHALCTPDGQDCRADVGGQSLLERYPNLEPGDLALRTFSFNARLYEDGTARGMAQFDNRGREQAWDADVGCMWFASDKPNQVLIGATLTRGYGQAPAPSGVPYEEGARVIFAVEDNGEGSEAAPDRILGFGTATEAQYQGLCAQAFPNLDGFFFLFGFDPIRGNIQVSPPSAD
ncbi:MAG: hypothetical protein OEO23_03940 [Gemmatimonadota bacterium]|nr:hypothetical protein [Gemmatimonadota bacterium]